MSLKKLYLTSGLISGFSKVALALTAFAIIWFINEIAGKDGYGLFAIAFSFYFILAMALGTAFRALMVYHISRDDTDDQDSPANKKAASLLGLGLLSGLILMGLLIVCADFLAKLWGKPELTIWLEVLAPLVPAQMFNYILTSWYQGRQNVSKMVFYMEIFPAIFRILALVIGIFFFPSILLIGIAFAGSFAVPAFILYLSHPLKMSLHITELDKADFIYGFESAANQLVNKSSEQITTIILGGIASAEITAEFALALRFAQLLMLPKLAIGQLLMPRLGQLIKQEKTEQVRTEFDLTRLVTTLAVLSGCTFFCLAGLWALNLIGSYKEAFSILLILSAASLIRTAFGDSGSYLPMAGYVRWGIITNVIGLIVLICSLLIFIPFLSGNGAAIAVMLSACAAMASKALVIYKKDKLNTVNPTVSAVGIIGVFVLLLCAYNESLVYAGGSMLVISILALCAIQRKNFLHALQSLS